jgi:hypothetical protein
VAAEEAEREAARVAAEEAEREAARVAAEEAEREAARVAAEEAEREAARVAAEEAEREAARVAAEEAEREAARVAAEEAEREAARVAAEEAEREAACVAAEEAEREAARDAARVAALDTTAAVIINDGNELKSVTVVDGAMEGVPFAVLKTKCLDGTKVFVNMCSNNAVMRSEILIGTGCPHDIPDKSGEICIGYDACVSADAVSEETLRNEVLCGSFIFGCLTVCYMQTYYRVLEFLNTTYSANLEELFKLPKIKGNFKGEHTPMFNRISAVRY